VLCNGLQYMMTIITIYRIHFLLLSTMVHPNNSAHILAIQAVLDERKISHLSFTKLFDLVISALDRPFEVGCLFGHVFDTSAESYPSACSQLAVCICYWWCWWVYIDLIPPILTVHKCKDGWFILRITPITEPAKPIYYWAVVVRGVDED
jgi:hypothetical protein